MDLLETLNQAQKEAVTTTEGYIRVIAGAGSGKTRALTHRFAYLVNELGIMPGNILCVTFTNKAANEMRERIHNLTGDNDTGYINTFHGFCVSVLREDSYAVQYPKSFLVLDNSDIDSMLKIIYEERGLTLKDMTFARAREMFEIRKLFKEPQYYLDLITLPLETLKKKYEEATAPDDILFYGYLYQEKKCFGLDYNDLIKFTLYIFSQNESIRLKWQERLEYIMIDEFQDIDSIQYELMEALCAHHGNLFIVGDPDQTIYTWRGANVKYLLDFDKAFPNVKTIMMNENYRSTRQILNAANSMIAKNKYRIAKDLIPVRGNGEKVVAYHADTSEEEARWIADQIKGLQTMGIPLKQMTVLYRAHYVTRQIEEVLIDEKIPYTIYSGVQFFGRMEIKDALCYLRMIAYKDDLSFLRVANIPKRNLGIRRIKYLTETAEKEKKSLYETLVSHIDDPIFKGTGAKGFIQLIEKFVKEAPGMPISEVLSHILDESSYEAMLRTEGSQVRLDNLAELKQSVYEFETSCGEEATLESYLSHVALYTNTDMADVGDKVKLMTVHTAKGLEFPYVFLCGLNEGIFPSRKTLTLEQMEEERRLFFVAMTRAKEALYLSEAAGRNFDGSMRFPSRFVLDIDEAHLDCVRLPNEQELRAAREYIESSGKFLRSQEEIKPLAVGTRIRHNTFGEGTVIGIDEQKGAHIIQFDELKTPRRISVKVRLNTIQ